jgi:hypothetical protein
MESAMTFEPGTYYIGDPGFIFQDDDLRSLFKEIISPQGLQSGKKDFIASRKLGLETDCFYPYFVAKLPHYSGTLYDKDNNGWGFEWGAFGCVPWEWVKHKAGYENHKVTFTEPFDCSCTEDSVTIGHLHFTLNPK